MNEEQGVLGMEQVTKEQDANPVAGSESPPVAATRYIRIWTVLGVYVPFCFAARKYSSRGTSLMLDVLPLCVLTTTTAFFISDALYIKFNSSQSSQSPNSIPWNRRGLLNSFFSNIAATFISRGTLSLSDIIAGFIQTQIGTYLQSAADDALGTETKSHRSRLTHVLGYLGVVTTAYMFAPSSLESTIFYFIRVYLRATFNTILDFLEHLFTSPSSRRNTVFTLLLLLPSVSIATVLLFRAGSLCPNCSCGLDLYNLIYTSACYSQISLSDPRALHKTIACAQEHNLRSHVLGSSPGPVEVQRVLSLAAPRLEKSCTASDFSRAWTQACISVSGAERGHQFGSGICHGVEQTMGTVWNCMGKFEVDGRMMSLFKGAVGDRWGG